MDIECMGENLAPASRVRVATAVRCSHSVPECKMKLSSKKEFNFISCSIILEAVGQALQGKLCRNMSTKRKIMKRII